MQPSSKLTKLVGNRLANWLLSYLSLDRSLTTLLDLEIKPWLSPSDGHTGIFG